MFSEYKRATCDGGGELKPNPDIAGLGLILAFLITAWTAFGFLATAYLLGYLPGYHIKRADKASFKVNSRRADDRWRATLDKVVLIFSDQQLIAGLAIIIAGFVEALTRDLSSYHWHIVTYLAWLSSTVHLITLSLLRSWLSERLLLRNLRMLGMLILLGLLGTAIYPSLNTNFTSGILDSEDDNSRGDKTRSQATPVRCFWGGDLSHSLWPPNGDAVLSYVALIGGYLWKISQAFDSSRNQSRRWLFTSPSAGLERAAKRRVDGHGLVNRMVYRLLVFAYVILVLVVGALESFMATLFFLIGTLIWGTEQLLLARLWAPSTIKSEENVLSFGQLLSLLLLLQPLAAVIEHFGGGRCRASPPRPSTSGYHSIGETNMELEPMQKQPTNAITANSPDRKHDTLSQVLRSCTLLSPVQKLDENTDDPVLDQVHRSRLFRFMIWGLFASVASMVSLVFWSSAVQSPENVPIRFLMAVQGLPLLAVCIPISLTIFMPFSRRLS